MTLKTGIELIAQERKEQLEKHGRTIEKDVAINTQGQLAEAAVALIPLSYKYSGLEVERPCPKGWDKDIWLKMSTKDYKSRLIIAGALIAAEYDRVSSACKVCGLAETDHHPDALDYLHIPTHIFKRNV